ncbi:protein of unknown function DUF395 YeeE/YedE [Thalassoporum mexicanum PCC 7367]|uniref:DUF6691 family protein n=1 Tax=Thalassoporum mexicanum TaxID=3457544 RepID=UPI00029FC084|nr:DUF6691 family protein [Pseudanabaena sp. PCC 7367]AFY70528.1 protein of unknown function DUF395 YeeE/YedE [Pseudanabaena sp. PCC 7367]
MLEQNINNQQQLQNKQYLIAFSSGLIFGLGLSLSQMIDRQRVLGFLDLFGNWDPTLLFVLCGAVATTIITFRFVLKLPHPIWAKDFKLPTKKSIDLPLVSGAIIFGIGWGIAGYCPGPAVTFLVSGSSNPVLFIAAFIVGSLIYKAFIKALLPKA